jgi:AGCS family alanine or glycine:cation symporter
MLESVDKNTAVQMSVASLFTNLDAGAIIGAIFVAVCLSFFAFSTIISWNFFGKVNFEYLFGKKAVIVYSTLAIAFIFLGTVMKSSLVWALQDMFNQLMVLPNVIALFALSKMVVDNGKRETEK